jgi:hypothetical protein
MEYILEEIEDMVITFGLEVLSKSERDRLDYGQDILDFLSPQIIHEIKDRIWYLIRWELNWELVLQKLQEPEVPSDISDIETASLRTE